MCRVFLNVKYYSIRQLPRKAWKIPGNDLLLTRHWIRQGIRQQHNQNIIISYVSQSRVFCKLCREFWNGFAFYAWYIGTGYSRLAGNLALCLRTHATKRTQHLFLCRFSWECGEILQIPDRMRIKSFYITKPREFIDSSILVETFTFSFTNQTGRRNVFDVDLNTLAGIEHPRARIRHQSSHRPRSGFLRRMWCRRSSSTSVCWLGWKLGRLDWQTKDSIVPLYLDNQK